MFGFRILCAPPELYNEDMETPEINKTAILKMALETSEGNQAILDTLCNDWQNQSQEDFLKFFERIYILWKEKKDTFNKGIEV